MIYFEDDKLTIRNMETEDAQIFTDELTAQGWHPDIAGYMSRLKDQTEGKCIALSAVYEGCFHTGGAPALRPGAIAQSPGREAALCRASLPKACPASGVRAREGAGCGSVGAVSGA